jgi:hypothetical protein
MRFGLKILNEIIKTTIEKGSGRAPGLRHQGVPRHEDAAFTGEGAETQGNTEGVESFKRKGV